MAMMILGDIKLFVGLIYIYIYIYISGLSNHLIYHRHKKIKTKLYSWSKFGG